MTETTRHRSELRAAVAAEQVARQRRGAALLGTVLARAAADGLPPVAWTIGSSGAGLAGQCEASRMDQRRQDFDAWRLAVGTWAGQAADARREYTHASGTVRLVDQWDQFEGVIVTLTADIWAEC
ncbi:MAG TPA: hypothetical protein VMR00_08275 [Streptosporangiaceae bacterium]|jgi:hypothetical protein|nr:hypothetical protein [Streptosporangiaceae bacterium]